MKNATLAACAALVACWVLLGCAEGSTIWREVTILDAKLQEWTSPDDGKTYLLAVPTWRNDSESEIVEVWMAAKLAGASGSFQSPDPEKPLYCGNELPPGATFHPTTLPDDAVIVGERDIVFAETGPKPKVEFVAVGLEAHHHAEGGAPANPPPL